MSGVQSRAHRLGHIDSNWPDVWLINGYAVFMGYLSMVVTRTGFLVLTWSTVVLLGGFVSVLSNKDFWSLTVITLVQTRIFDVFLNGKISHIGYSMKRLWKAARFIALPHNHKKVGFRGAVRVLVFTLVLCPLFLLYMFGLFVSPWIALWRLIQQDYGVTAGDSSSKAHLRPALVILYSLALFQGVLFYYRAISAWEEHKLVKNVADKYRFDSLSSGSVSDYLHEIKVGCEKDPSFASGRNLITYAAKLMESTSPDGYLSGARILDTLIQFNRDADAFGSEFSEQSMLICNTIGSASSGSILHKLVQMLGSINPRDREIRLRAMRIVDNFSSEIRLDKIVHGIQFISSLLDKQDNQPNQGSYHISVDEEDGQHIFVDELQFKGMQILLKLSDNENNLRVMSNTDDLALKIAELMDNRELHCREHNQWSNKIAEPGVELISRFMSATTRSNINFLRKISKSKEVISTLEIILYCHQCDDTLKERAVRILTQICMDPSSVLGDQNRKRFIRSLMDMFLDNSKGDLFENLAGEELAQLSGKSESSAAIILQEGRTSTIVDHVGPGFYSSMHRKTAADILKHLYSSRYSSDEQHFQNLNNAMIELMPTVLREVLGWVSTGKETRKVPTPAHNLQYVVPSYVQPRQTSVPYHQYPSHLKFYPTPQYYSVPPAPGSGLETTQYDEGKLKEALAPLCATVYHRMVRADADLTARFDDIAARICEQSAKPRMTFTELITEAEKVAAQTIPLPFYVWHLSEENPNSCCIS